MRIRPKKNQGHDQKSSLFVGRWQPFHKGHQALIESVLKKRKPVVVAIRDTEISHKNPYTIYERWTMIQRALHKYGELVKIVTIPDIDEICYGRDVGYAIRKIELDGLTEKISGTEIREKRPPTKPVIWLTGQSGAGKTTLARLLQKEFGGVILDGDEMRRSISRDLGFSPKDREIHNLRVARLAKVLSKKSLVIVSVIAPFEVVRERIDEMVKPIWVYVKRKLPKDKNKPYEPPKKPDLVIDTDLRSPKEGARIIAEYIKKLQST